MIGVQAQPAFVFDVRQHVGDDPGHRVARCGGAAVGGNPECEGTEDPVRGDAMRLRQAAHAFSIHRGMPRPASKVSIAARSPSPRMRDVRLNSSAETISRGLVPGRVISTISSSASLVDRIKRLRDTSDSRARSTRPSTMNSSSRTIPA